MPLAENTEGGQPINQCGCSADVVSATHWNRHRLLNSQRIGLHHFMGLRLVVRSHDLRALFDECQRRADTRGH
jgi:hypothetical protein